MFGPKSTMNEAIRRITAIAAIPLAAVLSGVMLYAVLSLRSAPSPKQAAPMIVQDDAAHTAKRPSNITLVTFQQETSDHEQTSSGSGDHKELQPQTNESTPAAIAGPGQPAVAREALSISLGQVDNLIREGNYPLASELLGEFESQVSGLLKVRIQLRRGLCAELQGKWQAALEHYRALADSHGQTAISDAAAIATARVLIERGRRDVGTTMLMRLLLGRERSMRKELRGDVVHTLAYGLAVSTRQYSWLQEDEWLSARHTPTPEALLKSWALLDAGERLPLHRDVLKIRQLTSDPSGILVSLESESSTLSSVLKNITTEVSWRLNAPETLTQTLQSRTMVFDCAELPLDVILDAVLKPNGMDWTFQDSTLNILRNENLQANDGLSSDSSTPEKTEASVLRDQLLAAERFQQLAINLSPDHPAAAVSYLLLGATVARKGEIDRAVQLLKTAADTFPRSPALGVLNVSLGKALLIQGDRELALKHFYKTVDRVSGIEIDTIAYLYIGRILIENDTARDAVAPLMRALSLSEETVFEAQSALLLSAAYLLKGNASAANTVLLNHRLAFEVDDTQSPAVQLRTRQLAKQGALISSLARFWGSNGTQRIREGRGLLSSLTTTNTDEWFGGHGAYLAGVAFAAVGLDSERNAVFRKCLMGSSRFPLQNRMTALLSGDLNYKDALSDSETAMSKAPAPATQSESPIPRDNSATHRTLLLRNEAAFRDGRYDEVMETCQTFLKDHANVESEIRKPMLRLMGLVYQMQGQHELAIRCLAGIAPMDNSAELSATNKDPQL